MTLRTSLHKQRLSVFDHTHFVTKYLNLLYSINELMIHLEHKENNVILIITTLFQVTFSEPSSKLTRCISDFPGAFKLASHDFYFIFKACQFLTSKATHSLSVICYATLPSSTSFVIYVTFKNDNSKNATCSKCKKLKNLVYKLRSQMHINFFHQENNSC